MVSNELSPPVRRRGPIISAVGRELGPGGNPWRFAMIGPILKRGSIASGRMAVGMDAIPELSALDSGGGLIRIPPQTDVPITRRVRLLIDTSAFRRLSSISQLGLVSLVYPAAHHSRFEHSLGVYRNALRFLERLYRDERFAASVTAEQATRFIAAALLHDIGHWPFCHPIEDIQLAEVPRHEQYADSYIQQEEIAQILESHWDIRPSEVTSLLRGEIQQASDNILLSLLSGPIDVDKMDYLDRDSLHAGVPYGRNFDRARLINSLCLNGKADALAITEKGRTAAEMLVFARYVMFSEVYWHHAVRAATAMLQRCVFRLRDRLVFDSLFRMTEAQFVEQLVATGRDTDVEPLLYGLFGPKRGIFKRFEQYSLFQQPEVYERLAQRPYHWLVRCSTRLAERLSAVTHQSIEADQILIDAPPVKREIEIDIDVYYPKESNYRSLAVVSPVVQTLAEKQFDDYVKRVRLFVSPTVLPALRAIHDVAKCVHGAIDDVEES